MISGRYETGRQVSEIVVELSPEAADAVINRHLERGARTGLIAESGGIAHGAIAASGMHLQRSATAGPPHDAYIPNQTIMIVAQPARRLVIGNKPSVICDDRIFIDDNKRTSTNDINIIVNNTNQQCEIRGKQEKTNSAGKF